MSIGSRKAWAKLGILSGLLFLLGSFSSGLTPQAQSDRNDNLKGYWRFDEGRGEIAHDETPFANDGRLFGPDWVLGLIEFGLDFYGRSGFSVQVKDDPSLDAREKLTLASWICLREPAAFESEDEEFFLFAKPYLDLGIYGLSVQRDEGWLVGTVALENGPVRRLEGQTPVPYERWVHTAFSYDAETGEARLYLDGKLDESGRIGPGPIAVNTAPLLLGAALDPSTEETVGVLPGIMDESRLYQRVLSPKEVLRLAKEAALAPQQECGKCYAPPAVNALLDRLIQESILTQEMFLRWLLILLNPAETVPMNAPFEEIAQFFLATGVIPEVFSLDPGAPITRGEAALLLLRALEIETPLLDQLLLSAGLRAAEEAALEIAVREGLIPPGDPDDILTGADLNTMSDWLLLRLETAPPSFYTAKDVACAQTKRLFRRQGPPPPGEEPPSS